MSRMIATVFGIGYLPFAPGTWGSLAALPLAWAIFMLGGLPAISVALALVTIAGWWSIHDMTGGGPEDPSEVVIDEVAGQWIALLPVLIGASHAGVDSLMLWPGWVAAFVLFRFFDMVKLGPVKWADRLHTPFGVMLDDLIAGLIAALGVGLLAWFAHGVMGV